MKYAQAVLDIFRNVYNATDILRVDGEDPMISVFNYKKMFKTQIEEVEKVLKEATSKHYQQKYLDVIYKPANPCLIYARADLNVRLKEANETEKQKCDASRVQHPNVVVREKTFQPKDVMQLQDVRGCRLPLTQFFIRILQNETILESIIDEKPGDNPKNQRVGLCGDEVRQNYLANTIRLVVHSGG